MKLCLPMLTVSSLRAGTITYFFCCISVRAPTPLPGSTPLHPCLEPTALRLMATCLPWPTNWHHRHCQTPQPHPIAPHPDPFT